jgi:hypothetical protein
MSASGGAPGRTVRVLYESADGGTEYVHGPGEVVAPGLAVVDYEGVDVELHWGIVQTESGRRLIAVPLCRGCAFAAAAVIAEYPGWDRPIAQITADGGAFDACSRAYTFGPCYPPADVERRTGCPLRIVGHTPGRAYRTPEGFPDGMGVLVPADLTDEQLTEMGFAKLAERVTGAGRPWYERS